MPYTTSQIGAAALVLAVTAGCASNAVEPEQRALVRAEAAIAEAEDSGAYEYGSAELDAARSKLEAAKLAADEGQEERAERLATQASLDAELAGAIASNREMQAAVAELNATIETLRQELLRSR